MTRPKCVLLAMSLVAAIAAPPLLRAQVVCPQSAHTIWVDAQRDAAGVQTLRDVRLCLDGILISAAEAEIVGDQMVLKSAVVTIPRDALGRLSRVTRERLRGDQLRELPQR